MAIRKRKSKRVKIFKCFLYAAMAVTSMYIFWQGLKIFIYCFVDGFWWRMRYVGDRFCQKILLTFKISETSSNLRRYLAFNTTFKDIRESPSTNNHDESTPRFPNLMVCNYQSHSRSKIKEHYSIVHRKHLASLYQT